MQRYRAIAVWAILSWTGLSRAAEPFTIRPASAATRVEVYYFLTGAFGGYGEFLSEPNQDGAFQIPLGRTGKPAKSLKAILYAPGCEFVLLSLDPTTQAERSATFECHPLSTILLRGRVSPPPVHAGALDVEVSYLSVWDHGFFGIVDGPIGQFSLGKTPRLTGGKFQINIPDFSKDRVTKQMQDAYLQVLVRDHSTWNIVEFVLPPKDLQYDRGLRILPDYGSEVAFERAR